MREAIYQRALHDVEQAKQQANGGTTPGPDPEGLLYLEGLRGLQPTAPEDETANDRHVAAQAAEFRCGKWDVKRLYSLWPRSVTRNAMAALQHAGAALQVLEAANTWQAQLQRTDVLIADGTRILVVVVRLSSMQRSINMQQHMCITCNDRPVWRCCGDPACP